jgi:hypothetical protein
MRCWKAGVVTTSSTLCEILVSCGGADEDSSLGDKIPCGLIHRYQCTEEHTSVICRVVQEASKENICDIKFFGKYMLMGILRKKF